MDNFGYCYKYTCVTYDCFCAPGTHRCTAVNARACCLILHVALHWFVQVKYDREVKVCVPSSASGVMLMAPSWQTRPLRKVCVSLLQRYKAVWKLLKCCAKSNSLLCCRRDPAGHVVFMGRVFRELWWRLPNSHTLLHDVYLQHPVHRPFEREPTLQQHHRLPRYCSSHCLHSFVWGTGIEGLINDGVFAVNGAWDEWAPWSLCSSTCGRGYRDRVRTCKQPQNGGEPCRGPVKQTKFCNIAVCPGQSTDRYSTSQHQMALFTIITQALSRKMTSIITVFCLSRLRSWRLLERVVRMDSLLYLLLKRNDAQNSWV